MPLGQAAGPGLDLASCMARLTELWRTVGHDSVNDQPVKTPTDAERELLRDLLATATSALEEKR